MSESTLHLKIRGQRLCAVCGADLCRPVSGWWLNNTWTHDEGYYQDPPTALVDEPLRACGRLPVQASSAKGIA